MLSLRFAIDFAFTFLFLYEMLREIAFKVQLSSWFSSSVL